MDDLGHWPWTVFDLFIVTVVATVAVNTRTDWAFDLPIGLAMAGALIWRRRRATMAFSVICGLAAFEAAFSPQVPVEHDVAVLVAMVAVVTHAPRLRAAYLSGLAVVLGLVVVAARSGASLQSHLDGAQLVADGAVLGLCAGFWLTAYVLRTRRMLVASLRERALTAERESEHLNQIALADERAAIARELHDVVAHSLAVMIVQAGGASYAVHSHPDTAAASLRTIAEVGRDALDDMHRIVDVLRGSESEAGDRRTVGLDRLEPLVRSAGLEVDLDLQIQPDELTDAEELTIVRIVQEALTNVLRHAGADARVGVTLAFENGCAMVEVVDDGGRPRHVEPTPRVGTGLAGMRERVASHGGTLQAGPTVPTGWKVRALIPVKS